MVGEFPTRSHEWAKVKVLRTWGYVKMLLQNVFHIFDSSPGAHGERSLPPVPIANVLHKDFQVRPSGVEGVPHLRRIIHAAHGVLKG